MKKIILEADTTNGVSEKVLGSITCADESDFFSSLKTLQDGERIACAVSKKMYEKIKKIYGISR